MKPNMTKIMKWFSGFLLGLFFVSWVWGESYVDFGKGLLDNKGNWAVSGDASVIDGFKSSDDVADAFYKNPGSIETATFAQMQQDENAKWISNSSVTRDKYRIDGVNDPIFRNQRAIAQSGMDLVNNNYQGCVSLPVNSIATQNYDETCLRSSAYQKQNFYCDKNRVTSCSNPKLGELKELPASAFKVRGVNHSNPLAITSLGNNDFLYGRPGDNYRGQNCSGWTDEITFEIGEPVEFFIEKVRVDDWVRVYLNDEVVFDNVGRKCERKGAFNSDINVNGSMQLEKGVNKLRIEHVVGGKGEIQLWFRLRGFEECQEKYDWKTTCTGGYSPGVGRPKLKERCIKTNSKGECVTFNQMYETLETVKTSSNSVCEKNLRERGCTETKKRCIGTSQNGCEKEEVTFTCQGDEATSEVSLCGETLICPDGNCAEGLGQGVNQSTDDFKKAATMLGVAEELVTGANETMLEIFKGQDKKCKKKPYGINDCCKDSGWGQDLGLAQCGTEEKELGIAREDGRTHFVGQYKQSDGLLSDSTVKVYCTYGSKLTRIIVEQAKVQMGTNYGTAKNPSCAGFTIEELQNLDFGTMDFSEFYADVMAKAENSGKLSSAQAQDMIQESLDRRFASSGNTGGGTGGGSGELQ